jgi:histidine triad (HIT) family protein
MNCFGCKLANKQERVNVIFEDDYVCCMLDHSPYNEGHVLILPKQHVRYVDELDEPTANSLMNATKIMSKTIKSLFNPDGITICQNGGMFDDLTHFHMHIVPRYKEQNFADFYIEDEEVNVEDDTKLEETKRRMIEVVNSFLS